MNTRSSCRVPAPLLALLAVIALLGAPGCAMFMAETPAQRYLAALGTYNAAKASALAWAKSPSGQANPAVIQKILLVDREIQKHLEPLSETATAYSLCVIRNSGDDSTCTPVSPTAHERIAFVLQSAASSVRAILAQQGVAP